METSKEKQDVSKEVEVQASHRSSLEITSAYFTIAAAAFGLISDGYQNSLMTMGNVVFKTLYPQEYSSIVSTRVSNALLVGAIIGQLFVGVITDRLGRKFALVFTTLLIVVGATLGTAAHGAHGSVQGLFWFLTVARGITGVGVGGEYPASSTSASEAANEQMVEKPWTSVYHGHELRTFVRRSFGYFHLSHSTFNCWRKSPSHCLACLLCHRDRSPALGPVLPPSNGQFEAL